MVATSGPRKHAGLAHARRFWRIAVGAEVGCGRVIWVLPWQDNLGQALRHHAAPDRHVMTLAWSAMSECRITS